jgi:phosphoesterase RecJ-like protein
MAYVTEEMFRKTGTTSEYTDGFSEEFRKIRGVEVSVFMRQTGEKRYKISMRSKGTVDVAQICSRFGGGGHKNAAGCHINGDLKEVESVLKKAFNIA